MECRCFSLQKHFGFTGLDSNLQYVIMAKIIEYKGAKFVVDQMTDDDKAKLKRDRPQVYAEHIKDEVKKPAKGK